MWSLKNELNGELFHLLADREYFVGRKDCDITIANDVSISRKHAVIKVLHAERNVCDKLKKSIFWIKDMSKFGSKVDDEKINNAEKVLKCGDVLVFGTGSSNKFTIVCTPLLVTTSCLTSPQKKEIRKMVFMLGGNMVNEWCEGCSHVVMSNLSVTIKVACALISQALIVNVVYLKDLVDTIGSGKCNKLPPVEDYLPIMAESQVNSCDVSFAPNADRSTLFGGKVFIFLAKDQFERLHCIVELGGGRSNLVDVSSPSDEMLESLISNPSNCVMFPDSNMSSLHFKTICTLLKRSKLRMIPESEVGFAVLYCSTESYCNAAKNSLTDSQNFQGFKETQRKNSDFTQSTNNFSSNSVKPKDKTIVDYFCVGASDDKQPKHDDNFIDQTSSDSYCKEIVKPVPSKPVDQIKPASTTATISERMVNCDTYESEQNTLEHPKELDIKPLKVFQNKSSTIHSKTSTPTIKRNTSSTSYELGEFLTTNSMNSNFQDRDFKQEMDVEGHMVVEDRKLLHIRRPLNQLSSGIDVNVSEDSAQRGVVKNFKRFRKSSRRAIITDDIPIKKYISMRDLVVHVNSDISDGVHRNSEFFDD